jgi:hypothetical protein
MQPAELLALRVQWRRISNDARAEFKLLFDRNHEQPGSSSSTPVHVSKVRGVDPTLTIILFDACAGHSCATFAKRRSFAAASLHGSNRISLPVDTK